MLTQEQRYILQEMGIPIWEERKSVEKNETDLPGVSSDDWDSLKKEAMSCVKCPLSQTRQHVVFGVGNPQAELLIIGEAPGANEDRVGEPFVGRAGQLLDAMLASIDLKRQDIYIANILKCRPPNNRDPTPAEVAACTPYLERQIAHIKPKLILALGRIAAHYLLGVDTPLGKLRGQVLQYGESKTDLIVTYHPAYLLRTPKEKGKAYRDMLTVKRKLSEV
ncbi:MAG: uracil-DNA glycosylase [Legionellales bacterium]|nr:uracil-DNA glycosylase [Legionellales bacterium]